jgi:hypothetical protein
MSFRVGASFRFSTALALSLRQSRILAALDFSPPNWSLNGNRKTAPLLLTRCPKEMTFWAVPWLSVLWVGGKLQCLKQAEFGLGIFFEFRGNYVPHCLG